jgi:glutamate 5-kinase
MRFVIKIGTSVIAPGGRIDANRMRLIVDQLDLAEHEYLLVSSGAIASGLSSLGIEQRPNELALMQASAAVGQSRLMHTYEQLFFGKKTVAQLLLSSDDFSSPVRYRNLCNTLNRLLDLKVLPIINENDSVSVRELEGAFGDNDELSALVAAAVRANWLILLTDVDGFYRQNRSGAKRVARKVQRITSTMKAACNGNGRLGRGGMESKLRAANAATAAGIRVAIANGARPNVIPLVLKYRVGTYFPPQQAQSLAVNR